MMTKSAPTFSAPHNSGERNLSVMADGVGADTGRASWSRDLIKEIAADIGADMVAYIEVQYPEAIKATSSTFKTSVRNHIINQVMAAIEITDADQIKAWLEDRKKHRRGWLKMWRNIRREKTE
jgi:hypothetical protein